VCTARLAARGSGYAPLLVFSRFLRSINYYGLVEVEFKLDPRDGSSNYWTSTRVPGDITRLVLAPASISPVCFIAISFPALLNHVAADPVFPGTFVNRCSDGLIGCCCRTASLSAIFVNPSATITLKRSFNSQDPVPGLMEFALIPYLTMKRGF